MKSLKTIQVLAKIGKILSKIIFILCIVGFCFCIAGIVSLAVGFDGVKLGSVTIRGILENKAGMSVPSLYAAMALGALYCTAEAVLSKFAEIYFRNELADGTPFTHRGAKELMRLGILTIVISLAAAILGGAVIAIASHYNPEVEMIQNHSFFSGLGVMMIVMSLFCRYGAELREGKLEETE